MTIDGRTLSPTRPVLPPEPTAPWVTNRRRGALPLLRRGPVPSYLPGRHPAVDRDAWPRLNWVGNSLSVALLLGAVVAGTALSEPLLRRLGAPLLGRAVGRVGTTGTRGRPDAARPTGWFDRVRAGGRLPLVATAVLQLPALLVGLLGALIIP